MPFRIGFKSRAGFFQCDMLADAGQDILQLALVGVVVECIIDGDQRRARRPRHFLQGVQAAAVFTCIKHGGCQPGVAPQYF